MSRWSQTYHGFWNQLRKADTIGRLNELRLKFRRERDLRINEIFLLEYCVLERMKDVAGSDVDLATQIGVNEFVPFCLRDLSDVADENKSSMLADRRRARELLAEWTHEFEEPLQLKFSEAICECLIGELNGPNRLNAAGVLGEIGLGTERVVDALLNAAESDEPCRANFLHCAISCGVRPSLRLQNIIEQVARNGKPKDLLFPLREVPIPGRHELIKSVIEQLEKQGDGHFLQVALSVLAETCGADQVEFPEAVNDTWSIIKQHEMMVLMDTRIAPAIEDATVVPEMLNWVSTFEAIEDVGFLWWRINNRLEECLAVPHLDSWNGALQEQALGIVRSQSRMDAGESTVSRTIEGESKLAAINALLMSGANDPIQMLLDAYTADEEWFLHRSIAELSCCIQITPLPDFVRNRIEEEFDNSEGDQHEIAKRDTALKIALSNGTIDAFNSLLNFGYTYKGGVLLDWTETLSSLAYELCRLGNSNILPALVDKLRSNQALRHRETAARAFSFLASRRLLEDDVVTSVIAAAADKELPDYARADLVNALNAFKFDVTSDAISVVARAVFSEDQPNLRLEGAAFLIRQGHWKHFLEPLWDLIGWGAPLSVPKTADGHLDDWKCVVITELFLEAPDEFLLPLTFALTNCEEDVCSRICHFLRRGDRFPEPVADCLLNRLATSANPLSSPAYLFRAIGNIDPKRLVSDEVWRNRKHWSIEGKVSYIDALRESTGEGQLFDDSRLAKLDVLCGDSSSAVRSAANQAIAILSPDSIDELFAARSAIGQPLWRNLLAAETVEFVSQAIRNATDNKHIDHLRHHQLKQVREQFRSSLKAGRQRDSAEHCREKLLSMTVGDNAEVLRMFPYGEALGKIGSIEDLRMVRDFLVEHQELKINCRAWLQQIINKISKRFESADCAINLGWNVIFETVPGRIRTEEEEIEAELSLWRQPGVSYQEPGTWGGTAVLKQELRIDRFFQLSKAVVVIQGRKEADFVMTKVRGNVLTVQGSGKYPYSLTTSRSNLVITIDGPAGSGKSTVARSLADRLNIEFLDTGAIYRSVALAILRSGISETDMAAVEALLSKVNLRIDGNLVLLNGRDVSADIRRPDVTAISSIVASSPVVREWVTSRQREIAQTASLVTEGREQGTKVFPDAELKFFLTTSLEVRARRRYSEMIAIGSLITMENASAQIAELDAREQVRGTRFAPAHDATVIDTSHLNIDQVVDILAERVSKCL